MAVLSMTSVCTRVSREVPEFVDPSGSQAKSRAEVVCAPGMPLKGSRSRARGYGVWIVDLRRRRTLPYSTTCPSEYTAGIRLRQLPALSMSQPYG